jgi:adenylate cyclase class IV
MPKIEIEFRSIINKSRYNELRKFLIKNAEDLGEDDKDVVFFIMSDKLLKVVNNISNKNAEIVFKANKIGKGSDFKETHILINQKDIIKTIETFKALKITSNIMRSFQKRHNYLYKGVEIALKYSEHWGYHLELEIMINSLKNKPKVEEKIKKVADELGVHLMSDKELREFTRKAEKEYKHHSRKFVAGI